MSIRRSAVSAPPSQWPLRLRLLQLSSSCLWWMQLPSQTFAGCRQTDRQPASQPHFAALPSPPDAVILFLLSLVQVIRVVVIGSAPPGTVRTRAVSTCGLSECCRLYVKDYVWLHRVASPFSLNSTLVPHCHQQQGVRTYSCRARDTNGGNWSP